MTQNTEGRVDPQMRVTRPDLIGALEEAVRIYYYGDGHLYRGALFNVVKALNPPLAQLMGKDEKAAYMLIQDMARNKDRLTEKDPWICLEGMTSSELDAYDYGVSGAITAIENILSGKDKGEGVSNDPWESTRRKLLALVALAGDKHGDQH